MSTTRTFADRVRAARFGTLVAIVSGAAMWLAVPAVDAAELTVTVDQVGWWTDRPVAPEAGEGAFEVAAGPDGTAQSIAAFQVTIPAGQVNSFALTMVEAAGAGAQVNGSLAICTTADQWTPADPGALGEAPTPDCANRVFMTPVLEERTWIGDIASLVPEGGTVSLMVVPDYAPPAPTPLGPGLVVRIAELQIAADGSSEAAPTTSTTLDFETPGGGNDFDDVPDSGFSFDPGPSVDIPAGGSFGGDTPTVIEDPGETPSAVLDEELAADDEFFTLDPEEAAAGEGRPWARLLVLVPLSAGIGVGSSRLRRLAQDGGLLGT